MSTSDLAALIITGALGALVIVCSIVLLTGRGSFLIAGFNTLSKTEQEKYDKIALTKFVGKILLPIGILIPGMAFCGIYEIKWFPIVFIFTVLGLVIFAVIYANTGKRFRK
jgi:hypothetical protein